MRLVQQKFRKKFTAFSVTPKTHTPHAVSFDTFLTATRSKTKLAVTVCYVWTACDTCANQSVQDTLETTCVNL